jgi:GrpB-like predicted nucleotidyltransferase (UPF0157 family)
LRAHPHAAERYVNLKRRLAAENDGHTLASRQRYSLSKSEFVDAIVSKALAQGYPLPSSRGGA